MNTSLKILVTGASGFIGRALCVVLKEKGYFVRAAVRGSVRDILGVDEYIEVGEIGEATDWHQALIGIDTVVHLAGRAHILKDLAIGSANVFRKVNALGTEHLAKMAVNENIRRLIFISSVKVNGEGSQSAYTEKDIPAPEDAYGKSKQEAEKLLLAAAAGTKLEVVILRLPLVYGPGVKANFKNLIKISASGLPLPFKGINNRRSFIYLGNLTDAIITCVAHPLAVGQIFMLSDGQDISTPDLIKMIALAMHKKVFLFSLHPGILKALFKFLGKTQELEKLTGSLSIDTSKIRNLLGWKASFTMEEGIKEAVKGI